MEKPRRSRIAIGAALLIGAAAVSTQLCSQKKDVDLTIDETNIDHVPNPSRTLPTRQTAEIPLEQDPHEPSSVEEAQNEQVEKVALCIESNGSRTGLDVSCRETVSEMTFPGSDKAMQIKKLECIAYDEEGHPESAVHSYIGPACEPDGIEDYKCDQPEEVTFVSVVTEVPLGSFVEPTLPSLHSGWGNHPLTEENSAFTAFTDTQAGLASEIDSLCDASLELLTNVDSDQNLQANDFSRELMNVSDFLVANGIDHGLPDDSRLFSPHAFVEIHFEVESGIPMKCQINFEEARLNCEPAYTGHLDEDGEFGMGEGMYGGLEDPSCEFEAPLGQIWQYSREAEGIRDCSQGYTFTEMPF